MAAVEKLQNKQEKNRSMICLGLDLDPKRMPPDNAKSIKGMYDFAMRIVDATSDLVCAYKPNMAFFENRGPEGLSLLKSVVERIPEDMPIIIDGKRGDIGNTASFYAEALYDKLRADWVTLNPYMGYDSMRPFLEYKEKGVFVLCLTSNPGSKDFQHLMIDGKPLYKIVAEKVDYWNKDGNCGLVVGATQPEELKEIREVAGSMPILIPGVGAQGGSLEKAVIYGTANFQKIALINVSRSVLYASKEMDFAQRARQELRKLNETVLKVRSGEITMDSLPADPPETEPQQSPQPPQAALQSHQEVPKQESKVFPVPAMPEVPKAPSQETPAAESPRPDETSGESTAADGALPAPALTDETPHQSHQSDTVGAQPAFEPQRSEPPSQPTQSPAAVQEQGQRSGEEHQHFHPHPAPQQQPSVGSQPQQPAPQAGHTNSAPSQGDRPQEQRPDRQDRQDHGGQRRFDRRHKKDRRHRSNRLRDNRDTRDNRPGNQDQPKPWERSS